MSTDAPGRSGHARRLARNTAFFSFATGLSRVLGLAREVVAASYFGVTGAMSAFTIAFQVPNLVRPVRDSALQGPSCRCSPSCSRRGAPRGLPVASTLFFLICLVLGAVTALFILLAEPVMSLFAPGFDDDLLLADLTVHLAQIMFPIVVLLAPSGLTVGMLNLFEHFAVPLAPVAWNVVIILALVGLVPVPRRRTRSTQRAIGSSSGRSSTLLPPPWPRGRGGRFTLRLGLAKRARPAGAR